MANFRGMQISEKIYVQNPRDQNQHGVDSAFRWEKCKLVQPPCGAVWQ